MQRNVRNKITFFTFGLLAGVTIGVVFGVAIKTLFSHLNALHISLSKLDSKEDQISQRLDSIEGKMSSQNKKTTTVIIPKITPVKSQHELQKDTTRQKKDTTIAWKKNSDDEDSLVMPVVGGNLDSGIVIMTNQLVTVSSVKLTNLDTVKVKKAISQSDSMLASMNNVDEDENPSSYRVEFWASPLNIKGYKMSRGKLILYGINSNSTIKLYKCDDAYYLLAGQVAYRIDYTDDFRPYEKVADKTVLKRLSL